MSSGLPDPDIQTGPWEKVRDGVQRNFDALAGAAFGTGGQQFELRVGTVAVSWAANVNSTVAVVTHGLGRAPLGVVATVVNSPQAILGTVPTPNIFGETATQFSLDAETRVAFTGSQTFFWIAIG